MPFAFFSDRTTDSSDNEPLIKIGKVSSKAAKKPLSVPPKDCVDKQKEGKKLFSPPKVNKKCFWFMLSYLTESSADGSDSDDEPLSEIAKKLSQRRKKAPAVSPKKEMSYLKPKGNRSKKIGLYVGK